MNSPGQRQAALPSAGQLPSAPSVSSFVTASRNVSCANLSDCGLENSALEGLETYDVGEYHLTSCPICLEHFTLDNPAILLKCEHGFHLQCLESWRQRSNVCPMCFTPVVEDQGRIMSATDARRRRRRRLNAPNGTLDAQERSVLIASAAASAGNGGCGHGCEHAECDDAGHSETEVIVVTSDEQDPHSWCGWLRNCCFFF